MSCEEHAPWLCAGLLTRRGGVTVTCGGHDVDAKSPHAVTSTNGPWVTKVVERGAWVGEGDGWYHGLAYVDLGDGRHCEGYAKTTIGGTALCSRCASRQAQL
jgi:hypothetical protein